MKAKPAAPQFYVAAHPEQLDRARTRAADRVAGADIPLGPAPDGVPQDITMFYSHEAATRKGGGAMIASVPVDAPTLTSPGNPAAGTKMVVYTSAMPTEQYLRDRESYAKSNYDPGKPVHTLFTVIGRESDIVHRNIRTDEGFFKMIEANPGYVSNLPPEHMDRPRPAQAKDATVKKPAAARAHKAA
jgi:hypothetical protein